MEGSKEATRVMAGSMMERRKQRQERGHPIAPPAQPMAQACSQLWALGGAVNSEKSF